MQEEACELSPSVPSDGGKVIGALSVTQVSSQKSRQARPTPRDTRGRTGMARVWAGAGGMSTAGTERY